MGTEQALRLLDEEFYWFWCGNEAQAQIFGPFRSQQNCEISAYEAFCDHDHMVMRSTGRRIVDSFPSTADYICGTFFVPAPDGSSDMVQILGSMFTDLAAGESIDLRDEMGDYLEQRNSSRSADMASMSPRAR